MATLFLVLCLGGAFDDGRVEINNPSAIDDSVEYFLFVNGGY